MPAIFGTLFLVVEVQEAILVKLFSLFRANDTDLVILASQASSRIAHGMDMQLRSLRLARQLTEALC
jgi:hypothetical protein